MEKFYNTWERLKLYVFSIAVAFKSQSHRRLDTRVSKDANCLASHGNWPEGKISPNGVPQTVKGCQFMASLVWNEETSVVDPPAKGGGDLHVRELLNELSIQASLGHQSYRGRFTKEVGSWLPKPSATTSQDAVSLALLIQMKLRRQPNYVEGEEVRPFDARRSYQSSSYPTPIGRTPFMAEIQTNYRIWLYYKALNVPETRVPLDLLRLTFLPVHVEQFKHDQFPPDFEPARSSSTIA